MAPIGTVLKNGLVYLVLSAPLVYVAALQIVNGFADLLYATEGGAIDRGSSSLNADFYNAAILEFVIALAVSLLGIGIIYMKALSDTVEDGMIEF
jgi:hypothetical protein